MSLIAQTYTTIEGPFAPHPTHTQRLALVFSSNVSRLGQLVYRYVITHSVE